jgi:hypothetical protein
VSELHAGVASAVLDPPLGVPMMGYSARAGVSERTHDPLQVRAVHLRGESDLLWIECDVCLLAPQQAREVRARISARTGVPLERILVGSVHTHSGPDTGFGELLAGREPPAFVAAMLEVVTDVGVRACAAPRRARLAVGRAEARIGRNRRRVDGPLDPEILIVRVDDAAEGRPLAIVYVHGCHPTALGHENLDYSADWPGAAAAVIRARHPGAEPVFALGAHADVDPRTRGLQDLAISGQSVGVSHAETAALGREVGEAVAEAAARLGPVDDGRVGAASTTVRVPVRQASERGLADALAALGLPADARPKVSELYALEHERTQHLPPAERRERIAVVRAYLRDRTARRFAFAEEAEVDVEVQVLRVADALFLALPLEPTVDVGFDWKRRAPTARAAVLGIANGWMRYLPHEKNYREPGAHMNYEVLQSTLVPDAATRLLGAAETLARGLV